MWRESHPAHPRGGRGLMPRAALAGMTMMALLGAFTGGLVRAADPDFSNVTDILGGKKYLLRQDDLVFTSTQIGGPPAATAIAPLYSTSSTVSFNGTTVPWGVSGGGANGAQGNFRTAVGRMFNLPNHVVATFAELDVPVLGVNVYDPRTGMVELHIRVPGRFPGRNLRRRDGRFHRRRVR